MISMMSLLYESNGLSDNTISDLQPGHANPGSSESDLVSGKMKGAVICTIVIQARYKYIIHDVVLVIPYNRHIISSRNISTGHLLLPTP